LVGFSILAARESEPSPSSLANRFLHRPLASALVPMSKVANSRAMRASIPEPVSLLARIALERGAPSMPEPVSDEVLASGVSSETQASVPVPLSLEVLSVTAE